MRVTLVVVGLAVLSATAAADPRPVHVYLERDGKVVTRDDGDRVRIPRFGGSDRTWNAMVACVQEEYAPFEVEITDRRPAGRDFITVVVGGRSSQMGLSDRSTDGVGPYDGSVQRSATVHVFSQIAGERDAASLCETAAHEIGHALGLDHEYKCGDIMSYFNDQCGRPHFLDVDVACGEGEERACGNGDDTQNSYQRLAQLVGLKVDASPLAPPPPPPDDDDVEATAPVQNTDPWNGPVTDGPVDPYVDDQDSTSEDSDDGDDGDDGYDGYDGDD